LGQTRERFFLLNSYYYVQTDTGTGAPSSALIGIGIGILDVSGPECERTVALVRAGDATGRQDCTGISNQERFVYLDKKYLTSVDLSWEEVRQVIINVGFEMRQEETGKRALYTADRRSMMNMNYRCVNFVARKGAATSEATKNDGPAI
jgi:hypothetical protein